jgi:arginyl-tRNA synthetase
MQIAQDVAKELEHGEELDQVWAAAPGFINFTLRNDWIREQVDKILSQKENFAVLDIGQGESVQVEYVSVNPTGPLHVGHARGAVLGSSLAAILRAAGYAVTEEYYVNDAGTQMETFAQSLYVRYQQTLGSKVELDPNGYQGEYVTTLAQEILREYGKSFATLSKEQVIQRLREIGLQKMLQAIAEDLAKIKIEFDVWFSESALYESTDYESAMEMLKKGNHTIEKEGAEWFASSALGAEKDNVLVRSSGQPTYFAADIAYHYNKFIKRGFQRVIDVWGADHQGHVPRMLAVMRALDIDPERLNILISQMVTLKRDGETLRASKRTGELITLQDLVNEVGPDACRFFFLARSAGSQMDFDLDLAKRQSTENPVYYVQYAHARIHSILNLAQENNIKYTDGNLSLLEEEAEMSLIRKMLMLPELIETMAHSLEPHHLPHYAMELATAFHWFYQQCRVVSNEPEAVEITKARLKLVAATRIALSHTLNLMGVTAPEKM